MRLTMHAPRGSERIGVLLRVGLPILLLAAVPAGGGYTLEWSTIDTGGATFSSGGTYTLAATIGQPDAGELSGGAYSLTGGFWFGYLPGDCDADGDTDLDDFVLFAGCLRGPGGGLAHVDCGCFDYDDSGDIDLLDFAEFQDRFAE